MQRFSLFLSATLIFSALATGTWAGPGDPMNGIDVSLIDKNSKETGKVLFDLVKCRSKCQKKASKCTDVQFACEDKARSKFTAKMEKLRSKRPDLDDFGTVAELQALVDLAYNNFLAVLEGSQDHYTHRGFPGTGQSTCYDSAGAVVPCAGTGHDGETQAGAGLSYVDNGDGTITDLNTGLMWEKKSDDGGLNDKDNTYAWYGACSGDPGIACDDDTDCGGAGGGACTFSGGMTLFDWIDALNAASYGGHADWRLPNIRELQSLVDFETSGPALATEFDTGCTPGCTTVTCSCNGGGGYGSSTSRAGAPSTAWVVDSIDGATGLIDKSDSEPIGARAVRSGVINSEP